MTIQRFSDLLFKKDYWEIVWLYYVTEMNIHQGHKLAKTHFITLMNQFLNNQNEIATALTMAKVIPHEIVTPQALFNRTIQFFINKFNLVLVHKDKVLIAIYEADYYTPEMREELKSNRDEYRSKNHSSIS